MNIIMNEVLQGKSRFSRLFMVSLKRELGDEENNFFPMNWHLAMKNLTEAFMQDENKQLVPGAFCKEDDDGFLPCLFQTQCSKFSSIGLAANFILDLPNYTEESIGETPVIKEISDNLLKDGIYLPFLMFIDKNDQTSVLEAEEAGADIYIILVSELTSEARGENLIDFYVATMNLSELFRQLGFSDTAFVDDNGEDVMRIIYPMLMSAISSDISSPYPTEVFQVSTYFQNSEPVNSVVETPEE